ncbi:cleavage stimulating factor 64-like [Vicia villosa]|uniref:cleavage stimulating factor 64-like n=1 Tax=Vicia villosa TaxID=3911 RepID=UPI00273AA30F|nr:cleavage stimulating factor 64-like [Vicia villosa]
MVWFCEFWASLLVDVGNNGGKLDFCKCGVCSGLNGLLEDSCNKSSISAHSMPMPQQPKGHLTPQVTPAVVPQSSQLPKIPPPFVGNMPFWSDFGSQAGNAMQIDRGSSWMPGPSKNPSQHSGPPGPPSMVSGQMGAANQSLRPPALTPDMEKALLQQVMSLTPEKINLLPPEQRNQVL